MDPIALHNNWVSPRSKLYRFREAGLWLTGASPLGPKPGTKYLTYFDAIEENGLNNQRQAFRNALAIARILNRTLIMPTFHRRHRVESPVPMDYFFDFDKFDAEFPGVEPHHFLEEAFPEWETLPVQVSTVKRPARYGFSWRGAESVTSFACSGRVAPVFGGVGETARPGEPR